MTAIVPSGDNEPAAPLCAGDRPVWQRCGCDQWGRCLTDCPTAHLPWREQPIYRRMCNDTSCEAQDFPHDAHEGPWDSGRAPR